MHFKFTNSILLLIHLTCLLTNVIGVIFQAAGRLKNTIAAALLTEIYPSNDVHETVVQLDRPMN